MQAAPDVVERGAKARQRIGLLVDIPEFDRARAHQREQLVALPVDAGIADRAAGVVPDGEVGTAHQPSASFGSATCLARSCHFLCCDSRAWPRRTLARRVMQKTHHYCPKMRAIA